MRQVIVALGSNVGDRAQLLRAAVADLAATDGVEVAAVSPVVTTRPVGGPEGQPDYLNAVVRLSTTLGPFELLAVCQAIETAHDRVRDVRWGPRTLDVDIVDYAGLTMDEPALTLPHPRAAERAFVLVPWSMMDADAQLHGTSVRLLAERAEDFTGVAARSDLLLADVPAQRPVR